MDILLVEDNEFTRGFIEASLQRAGHRVVAVSEGREGIEALGKRRFDLMITDIFMPECDGLELLRFVRTAHCGMPVVVISGGTPSYNHDYLGTATKLGAAATLPKPFGAGELIQLVDSVTSIRTA